MAQTPIRNEDLYGLLGVDPDATPSGIRKAYFRLAKVYHPDRQVVEDPEATEKFLAIQRAYEVLSDHEQREHYDQVRQRPVPADATDAGEAGAADPDENDARARKVRSWGTKGMPTFAEARDARRLFMKAEALMETGETDKALTALRAIVKAVPNDPEYQSVYGYLLAQTGEKLHEARDACRRALAAEPYNAEYHARLGYVYLRAGLQNSARQCAEKALEINPKLPLAQELNFDLEPGSKGLGSMIKGLFGR